MKAIQTMVRDIRASYPGLKFIMLISGICLLTVVVVHIDTGIPVGDMTRDPAAVGNFPFYIGFLSYIGILFCCGAAAICLFSAYLGRTLKMSDRIRGFLLYSGLLSLLLGVDDLFMLHEVVFPNYLGVTDNIVYGVYLLIGLIYLIRFRRDILRSSYPLFGCAVTFLCLSVLLDAFPLPRINPFLLEDGSKFIGWVSWLAYFAQASASALQSAASHSAESLHHDVVQTDVRNTLANEAGVFDGHAPPV